MKSGPGVRELVASLQHVELSAVTLNSIISNEVATVWGNCTVLAELAQQLANPRGRSENAKLCREIIKLSADIKLDLASLMSRKLTHSEANKLLNGVKTRYRRMRDAMTELGRIVVPGLEKAIPNIT